MATGNPANRNPQVHCLQPGLGFVLLFLTFATVSSSLMTPLFRPAQRLTIATTMVMGKLLGLPMTSSEDILTVNGFAMRIVDQCTALNYAVILTVAILLYTRHSLLYRISGIIVSAVMVLIINSVRLIVTGLAGATSYELFHVAHEYLWVAIFALLIFGIWKAWADRKVMLGKETIQKAALTTLCCSVIFLLLLQFKNFHCHLLTTLATPLYKFLLDDSGATMMWDGASSIICRHGETTLRLGLFFEIANLAVYAGLMLPFLWHNRKAIPDAVLGLAVLVIMYAEFIAIMGVYGINHGYTAAMTFGINGSGIFLALPMALYWMIAAMANKENSRKKSRPPKRPGHCRHGNV